MTLTLAEYLKKHKTEGLVLAGEEGKFVSIEELDPDQRKELINGKMGSMSMGYVLEPPLEESGRTPLNRHERRKKMKLGYL